MSNPQKKVNRKPAHPAHFHPRREKLHEIIFEADTPLGKAFDIVLLILIVMSILLVMLESIDTFQASHRRILIIVEWVLTVIFTIEYILR